MPPFTPLPASLRRRRYACCLYAALIRHDTDADTCHATIRLRCHDFDMLFFSAADFSLIAIALLLRYATAAAVIFRLITAISPLRYAAPALMALIAEPLRHCRHACAVVATR